MQPSQRTRQHITNMFAPSERDAAERLLAGLFPISYPGDWERIHFAALRLSRGVLAELAKIVRLDPRDIMSGAGFGRDVHAHENWVPRLLTSEVIGIWEAGGAVDGVHFRYKESAKLDRGRLPADPCVVVSLTELEPEPRFKIHCDTGESITVPQSWLRPSS